MNTRPQDIHTGTKIFLALLRPLQRLPLKFHYFWGKVFAFLCRKVLHYRRNTIITNISRSFPELKYAEIDALAKDFYDHLGEIFAEAMWYGGCKGRPGRLHAQRLCVEKNISALEEAYRESPSVMILTSHAGNWELIGGFFEFNYENPPEKQLIRQDDMCVVYKAQRSRFWDEFFMCNRLSCETDDYGGYTESRNVLRYAVEHRKDHLAYIFITDQFPYMNTAKHEIPSFMNQKTYAVLGGAALASKMGMSVFYMGMERKEKGHYEMTFTEITRDASSMTPQAIMEKFYALLEEDIRKAPANYLWSHRRWK